MLKRLLISPSSASFHHLATFPCNIYLIFEKVAPEDLPVFTGTTPKPRFYDSEQPRNHMYTEEKREERRERREEKKGLLALIIYILATLNDKKSVRDTPAKSPSRAVSF